MTFLNLPFFENFPHSPPDSWAEVVGTVLFVGLVGIAAVTIPIIFFRLVRFAFTGKL